MGLEHMYKCDGRSQLDDSCGESATQATDVHGQSRLPPGWAYASMTVYEEGRTMSYKGNFCTDCAADMRNRYQSRGESVPKSERVEPS